VVDECIIVRQDGTNHGFPKGGREKGESLLQNALRELKEETGLTMEHIDLLPPTDCVIEERNDKQRLCVCYLVASMRDNQEHHEFKFTFDPKEIDEVQWMRLEAAEVKLVPRRRTALRAAHVAYLAWKNTKRAPSNKKGMRDAEADEDAGKSELQQHDGGSKNVPTPNQEPKTAKAKT
jgi:8-oxo-dGTP pyrophosphatase MutT (NUDIX family)